MSIDPTTPLAHSQHFIACGREAGKRLCGKNRLHEIAFPCNDHLHQLEFTAIAMLASSVIAAWIAWFSLLSCAWHFDTNGACFALPVEAAEPLVSLQVLVFWIGSTIDI